MGSHALKELQVGPGCPGSYRTYPTCSANEPEPEYEVGSYADSTSSGDDDGQQLAQTGAVLNSTVCLSRSHASTPAPGLVIACVRGLIFERRGSFGRRIRSIVSTQTPSPGSVFGILSSEWFTYRRIASATRDRRFAHPGISEKERAYLLEARRVMKANQAAAAAPALDPDQALKMMGYADPGSGTGQWAPAAVHAPSPACHVTQCAATVCNDTTQRPAWSTQHVHCPREARKSGRVHRHWRRYHAAGRQRRGMVRRWSSTPCSR